MPIVPHRIRVPGPLKTAGQNVSAGSAPPTGFVSTTRYASAAALESAFPAASNSGSFGLVDDGPGGDPQTYESNGTSWGVVVSGGGGGYANSYDSSVNSLDMGAAEGQITFTNNNNGGVPGAAIYSFSTGGQFSINKTKSDSVLEYLDTDIVTLTPLQNSASDTLVVTSTAGTQNIALTGDLPPNFNGISLARGAAHSFDFESGNREDDEIGSWPNAVLLGSTAPTYADTDLPTGGLGRVNMQRVLVHAYDIDSIPANEYDRSTDRSLLLIVRLNANAISFNASMTTSDNFNSIDFIGVGLNTSGQLYLYTLSSNSPLTGSQISTGVNTSAPRDWAVLAVSYDATALTADFTWHEKGGSRTTVQATGVANNSVASCRLLLGSPTTSIYSCEMDLAHVAVYNRKLVTADLDDYFAQL